MTKQTIPANPFILAMNAAYASGQAVACGEIAREAKAHAQTLADALPVEVTKYLTKEWIAAQTKRIDATVRAVVGATPSARAKGTVAPVGSLERFLIEGAFRGYTGVDTPAKAAAYAAKYAAAMATAPAVPSLGASPSKAETAAFVKATKEAAKVTEEAAKMATAISTTNTQIRRALVALIPKADKAEQPFRPVDAAKALAERIIAETEFTLNKALVEQCVAAMASALEQALIENAARQAAVQTMGPALV